MTRKKPKYFQDVVTVITELKAKTGSSVRKVMNEVHNKLIAIESTPKQNLVLDIHRAITHGIRRGIIKQKSDRLSLCLPKRVTKVGARTKRKIVKNRVRLVDCANFQNFKRFGIKSNKRGRKRKNKKTKQGRKQILTVGTINKTEIIDCQEDLEEVGENDNINDDQIQEDPKSDNEQINQQELEDNKNFNNKQIDENSNSDNNESINQQEVADNKTIKNEEIDIDSNSDNKLITEPVNPQETCVKMQKAYEEFDKNADRQE